VSSSYLGSEYITSLAWYFNIIVLDRVFYLVKSIRLKLMMHYALLGYTLYEHMSGGFEALFADSDQYVLFILDSFYFGFSALQIGYGYPKFTR